VSEAAAICVSDLDLEHKTLTIHGKGSKERIIPLEKKAHQALKSYLAVRPKTADHHLFLNYQGVGLPYSRRAENRGEVRQTLRDQQKDKLSRFETYLRYK